MGKIITSFCIAAILLIPSIACKKDKESTVKGLKGKIVCGDCYYTLQNSQKVISQGARGKHEKDIDINAKPGDTILFVGYNYSLTTNMDGYIMKNAETLKHGVTHCGGNPTFFLQYIVQ